MQGSTIPDLTTSSSTMCATVSKGSICLSGLLMGIPISKTTSESSQRACVIFAYGKYNDRDVRRGTPPARSSSKSGKENKVFANQVTVIFSLGEKYHPNVKVFRNGQIQATGVKLFSDMYIIVHYLRHYLALSGHCSGDLIERPIDYGARIAMMNCDFKLPYHIKLPALHQLLKEKGWVSVYAPEHYACVKVYYFGNANGDGKCCCAAGHIKGNRECVRSVASVSSSCRGATGKSTHIGITGNPNEQQALLHAMTTRSFIMENIPYLEVREETNAKDDDFASFLDQL